MISVSHALQSSYFVMEAQSSNSVSLKDITGRHGYDLYSVNRAGVSESLSLSITPNYFIKQANSNYNLDMTARGYLHMEKVKQNEGIADLVTLVVTNTTVIMYNPKSYASDSAERNIIYRFNLTDVSYTNDSVAIDC